MPYADPAKKKAFDSAYGRAHLEQARERQRRHRKQHPEKSAEYTAKWKYGITAEQYNAMFAAQDGRCLICRLVETTKDKLGRTRTRLSIDHDHETGIIRGLLCHHCNAALGHAKGNPSLLRAMAGYLEGEAS